MTKKWWNKISEVDKFFEFWDWWV